LQSLQKRTSLDEGHEMQEWADTEKRSHVLNTPARPPAVATVSFRAIFSDNYLWLPPSYSYSVTLSKFDIMKTLSLQNMFATLLFCTLLCDNIIPYLYPHDDTCSLHFKDPPLPTVVRDALQKRGEWLVLRSAAHTRPWSSKVTVTLIM
jgi:hypothetical protein